MTFLVSFFLRGGFSKVNRLTRQPNKWVRATLLIQQLSFIFVQQRPSLHKSLFVFLFVCVVVVCCFCVGQDVAAMASLIIDCCAASTHSSLSCRYCQLHRRLNCHWSHAFIIACFTWSKRLYPPFLSKRFRGVDHRSKDFGKETVRKNCKFFLKKKMWID